MEFIIGLAILIIVLIIVFSISGKHKSFIDNAQSIKQDMTINEVMDIMNEPPTSQEILDGKTILLWEKSQWKGMINGGTLTRSLKVVFINDKVVSVSTKNLDKSTF